MWVLRAWAGFLSFLKADTVKSRRERGEGINGRERETSGEMGEREINISG